MWPHGACRFSLLLLILAGSRGPAYAQTCHVVDLGVLPGQESSFAWDVNNRLQVVGHSGGEAFLWQSDTGPRPLGIAVDTTSRLHINNTGVIVGLRIVGGRREPFALVDGRVVPLPTPPGDDITAVRQLTDSNIVLMQGTRSWALVGSTLYDLTTPTGATISAVNDLGMVGGLANRRPYLRYWDGRILIPWSDSLPVQVIGPAGHFAASAGSTPQGPWYHGTPDGSVFAIAPFGLGGEFSINDINRRGDLVGSYIYGFGTGRHDYRPFLFRSGNFGGVPLDWMSAEGINDLGTAIVGTRPRSHPRIAPPEPPYRAELEVCPPPSPGPVPPMQPWRLRASISGRTVALSWHGSVGATDYIVEVGSAEGRADLYRASVGPALTISGEVPAGRYYVQVRARNAAGVSDPSFGVLVVVP